MTTNWLDVKNELARRTAAIFEECPDEIKRFHYGIITHSDAGKHSLNQYFGHWVHAYAHYMLYAGDILDTMRRMCEDPDYNLVQLKKLFLDLSKPHGHPMLLVEYGGQVMLGEAIDMVEDCLETLTTNEEMKEVVVALQTYASRLYWWFHWYFPWGLGTSCQRLSPEDIKEIVRLSQSV